MDKVVAYLLEKETITGPEMVAILEGRDPALADNFPDRESKKEEPKPASQPAAPIPLGGDTQPGQEEPPQENGTDFGPEGKPKE